MNEIMAIAGSVWRRILKMKVLYFLVICAVVEIGITQLYDILTMNEHQMLMVDLSLLLTTLSSLLVVLSLAFDIPKELREGGAAILLSKPVGRYQYLIGKFLGIVVVAWIVGAMISIGFICVHYIKFEDMVTSTIVGHLLALVSVVPMAAIALFFAAIMNEAAAAIFTAVAIWFAHSTHLLSNYRILYGGLLPDLNLFNLRAEATHQITINWPYLGLAFGWGIVYCIGLISLTSLIFNQRDLG